MRPESSGRRGRRMPPNSHTLALVALQIVFGCGDEGSSAEARTARVERGQISRIVVASGTIEPEKEVEVRSRVPGIVQRIATVDGQRVQAGEVLMELERELIEAQVDEARNAVREAEVETRFAQVALTRTENLKERRVVSDQNLDDARERFEKARAAASRATSALRSLEIQLGYTTITAPMAGTVLDVVVEEGAAVAPVTAVTGGTLLLSLAAATSPHLKGLVDENEVARVAVGQPATIRTEAYPERRFSGHVEEIAPLGQRVQNVTYFEVKVLVTDPKAELLRPRMSADADIVTEVIPDALRVPETALTYRTDGVFAHLHDGDGLRGQRERKVEIGIVDGSTVQILSGLEEGDEVVVQ